MPPKIKTERYERIPYPTDAVQITEDNFEDLSKWCRGVIKTDNDGDRYIEVDVKRVLDQKQRHAYVGDWLTKAGSGFKVFQDAAFQRCFRRVVASGQKETVDPGDLRKLQEQYASAQN